MPSRFFGVMVSRNSSAAQSVVHTTAAARLE